MRLVLVLNMLSSLNKDIIIIIIIIIRLIGCFLCIMSICDFGCFPFWFRGWDCGSSSLRKHAHAIYSNISRLSK